MRARYVWCSLTVTQKSCGIIRRSASECRVAAFGESCTITQLKRFTQRLVYNTNVSTTLNKACLNKTDPGAAAAAWNTGILKQFKENDSFRSLNIKKGDRFKSTLSFSLSHTLIPTLSHTQTHTLLTCTATGRDLLLNSVVFIGFMPFVIYHSAHKL